MTINKDWKTFQAICKNYSGTKPVTLDYLAVLDVLLYCCSGISNQEISAQLGIPIQDVTEILLSFLDYKGNSDDLPYNPYSTFLDFLGANNQYELFIQALHYIAEVETLDKLYKICYNVNAIEKEVAKYYGEN